jgi:hypothetical protein
MAVPQQSPVPVIGVMCPLSVATAAGNLAALRNGLRDLGYSVILRSAGGAVDV